MTASPLSPHYHVGIVVPEIAAARAELSAQLGVVWGPTLRLDAVDYRDESGNDIALPTTMCYSVGEPHLELILELPGSLWECNEYSNLHHIGFWSDDLAADGARLTGSGCPLQLCGRNGDVVPVSFSYHRNGLGVRVEIVNGEMRETMAFLFEPDEG